MNNDFRQKNFLCIFRAKITQNVLSLVVNAMGAWIGFFFILESHVMLRHKMDTKQQEEHIEHKPKNQAKYKKHFRSRYYFPRMSRDISWREESTETEGEMIFGNKVLR